MTIDNSLDIDIQVDTHPNGLRVVRIPRPAGSAAIYVRVNTGSRSESLELAGGCHLMEHLFYKGTAERPGPNDITMAMDDLGSMANAMTGVEDTMFLAVGPGRHAAKSAEILADMVLNARLSKDDFENEKAIVLEERRGRLDDPRTLTYETACLITYGDNPLGRPIIGTPDSILNLDHEATLDHIRRHYVPSNIILGIGGRFDDAAVEALVAPFAALPAAEAPAFEPSPGPGDGPRVKTFQRDMGQSIVFLTLPGFEFNHPDRLAGELLVAAIGGGASSKMFLKVREEQRLAYEISAMTMPAIDAGAWAVAAGVEASTTEQALEAIVKVLRDVDEHGLTEQEIERARVGLLSQHESMLDSAEQLTSWAIESLANRGDIPAFSEYEQALQAITAEDLKRVAETYFDFSELRIVAVGPDLTDAKIERIRRRLVDPDDGVASTATEDADAGDVEEAPLLELSDEQLEALLDKVEQFTASNPTPAEADEDNPFDISQVLDLDAELAAVVPNPRVSLARVVLGAAFMPPDVDDMGDESMGMGGMDMDMGMGGMDMGMGGMDMDMDMGMSGMDMGGMGMDDMGMDDGYGMDPAVMALGASAGSLAADHPDWTRWLRSNADPEVFFVVPADALTKVADQHPDPSTATCASLLGETMSLMDDESMMTGGEHALAALDEQMTKISDSLGDEFAGSVELMSAVLVQLRQMLEAAAQLKRGEPAPAFDFPLIGGGRANLDRYAGRYLLVEFTASWCKPCHALMPGIVDLHRRFGRDVSFLGVAVDDEPNALREYLDEFGAAWEFATMGDRTEDSPYAVPGIPHIALIGPDGTIIEGHAEMFDPEDLASILEGIVSRQRAAADAADVSSPTDTAGEEAPADGSPRVSVAPAAIERDGDFVKVALEVEVDTGWYVYAPGSDEGVPLALSRNGETVDFTIRGGEGARLSGRFHIDAAVPADDGDWALSLTVQPCSGDICLRPSTIAVTGGVPALDA